MRSGPAATAGLLLGLALFLPACGNEQTTAAGAETASSGAAAASPAKAAALRARSSGAAPRRCRGSLGGFLDSMESLDNTLAVGLGYDDYLGAVNHVRATYASVPAERLAIVCLARVASPAERALNVHIGAVNDWGDCLASASCDPESIEAKLQREWGRASDLLAEAHAAAR